MLFKEIANFFVRNDFVSNSISKLRAKNNFSKTGIFFKRGDGIAVLDDVYLANSAKFFFQTK